jgi:hypothetical protein
MNDRPIFLDAEMMPTSGSPLWLNNFLVLQDNDEEHLVQWSFNGVLPNLSPADEHVRASPCMLV